MNHSNLYKTGTLTCLILAAFLFLFSPFAEAKKISYRSNKKKTTKMSNTFQHPDFAYPKTVEKNALAILDQKNATPTDVLRALIQCTVASTERDQDKVTECLRLIDGQIPRLPAEYAALARLLQANIYNAVYEDKSWRYNSRQLDTDTLPADIFAWNNRMFRDRIAELGAQVMAQSDALYRLPLKEIDGVVSIPESFTSLFFPTALDFAVCNYLDLYGAGKERERLLTDLIDRHRAAGQEYALAHCYISLYAGDYDKLKECYAELKGSPASMYLLLQLAESSSRNDYYADIKEALAKWPDTLFSDNLRNTLAEIEKKSVKADTEGKIMPQMPMKVTIESNNVNNVYLHVFKYTPVNHDDQQPWLENVVKNGKFLYTESVEIPGTVPFSAKKEVTLSNPGVGYYALVPSLSPDPKTLGKTSSEKDMRISLVCVTTLATSYVKDPYNVGEQRFYVVEAGNQEPVKGAKVIFYPSSYRNRNEDHKVFVTNAEGFVIPPVNYFDVAVNYTSETIYESWNSRERESYDNPSHRAEVFTDLSIYHPGDTVNFSLLLYTQKDRSLSTAAGRKVNVEIKSANYQPVDTLELCSDEFGRCTGSFQIPKEGMLGTYRIEVTGCKYEHMGTGTFEVAEYKAPSFFIELDQMPDKYDLDSPVKISGKVMTYSGMPVGDAKIDYLFSYFSWWRLFGEDMGDMDVKGTINTDAEGHFSIELPTDKFRDRKGFFCRYKLTLNASDASGESVEGTPYIFCIGSSYRLSASVPSRLMLKDNCIDLKVNALNLLDNPAEIKLHYKLNRAGQTEAVAEGDFISPNLKIDASSLPSARYELEISAVEDESISPLHYTFTIFRADDKRAPEEAVAWTPLTEIVAPADAKMVDVKIGSAFPDSWLLVTVTNSQRVVSSEWVHVKNSDLRSLSVPAPGPEEYIIVNIQGLHNLVDETQSVTIKPRILTDYLQVETVTFRDRINPQSREKWTFRFRTIDGNAAGIPVMAVMSDKALNALAPFSWSFSPRRSLSFNPYFIEIGFGRLHSYCNNYAYVGGQKFYRNVTSVEEPTWETYDYDLFGGGRERYMKMERLYAASGSVRSNMRFRVEPDYLCAPSSDNEALKESDSDVADEEATAEKKEEIRPVECPLAFFLPNLTTDGNGEVSIDFEAPNFNTTWQLQVFGYTESLLTSLLTKDIVASKPVMVHTNLPRFLRTGDQVVLKATLMNNSDEARAITGVIEIFDPLTGEVLQSVTTLPTDMEPKTSHVVSLPYKVGESHELIGIRAFARTPEYSDGEQAQIIVLPSSTPVIEATTFYIDPADEPVTTNVKLRQLPESVEDARLTLTYCDNPIWLCVNALPIISLPDPDASILNKTRLLFGNSVARMLAIKYPQLQEAIKYWEENEPQISPLSTNEDLKNIALKNTIWVNSGEDETLRMAQLSSLLDPERATQAISSLVDDLRKCQHADGGWGWTNSMESSQWITGRVLLNLAMIKMISQNLGVAMPAECTVMINNAVDYCDSEIYQDYKRNRRTFSTIGMLNYLYVRSFTGRSASQSNVFGFSSLAMKALKKIASDWRDFDIYNTATAATLLMREKRNPSTVAAILESLSERSVEVPGQGVCYANLKSSYDSFPRLITTAQVLEAFHEGDPQSPMVDKLRQWIIVQRQAQNWGTNEYTAELIYAILMSGSDWTMEAAPVKMSLDGKALDLPASSRYSGEVRMTLPKTESGAEPVLTISREGHSPAWGGVVYQYIAPIVDVQAASVPDLSISKTVVAPAKDLKPGDKVRVTLTITSRRDIQYVSVTDDRGACLNPVDQLSSYYCSDGVWMYKEVRNSATNLMIPFLAKGTHVVSYEAFVTQEGEFATGIATVQSLYAPTLTAHSAGALTVVEP